MARSIVVALGVRWPDGSADAIRAVDPRVEVVEVPELFNIFYRRPDAERMARIRAALAKSDVAIAWGGIEREELAGSPRLRWLHVAGAGLERLAASGGLDLGLMVTNSAGAQAGPIAEWVVAAILLWAKRLDIAVVQHREQRWEWWNPVALEGKTVGICGFGAIGREVARRLRPFGVRVIATRRSALPGEVDPDTDLLLPNRDRLRLVAEADFVVLSLPLTPETTHFIGKAELAVMKPGACLVNIARGKCVDQDEMMAALHEGRLGGAILDVTDPEPLPAGHPLWTTPNVLIAPHISGRNDLDRNGSLEIFCRNLRAFIDGSPMENVVPPGRGY